MSYTVLTDAYISFTRGSETIVLDKQGSAVAIAYSSQPSEIGVMGQKNKLRVGNGPTDWNAEFEIAISESDHGEFFHAAMGQEVAIEVRKTSDAVSEDNPSYEGTAILTNYQIMGSGKHGDIVAAQVSFVGASDLLRVTA